MTEHRSDRFRLQALSAFLTVTLLATGRPTAAQDTATPIADDLPFIGSQRALEAVRRFPRRGDLTDPGNPPRSAQRTVESFKVIEGLKAEAVLHEPVVRQPVFLNFDEQGRMWVAQMIQYPYPAGVKVIDFDHQFHATYDRVAPPPPHAEGSPFRGASRVTIHEDTDGDGTFDRHAVFLDGLNMVTSVERGRGGVWVLEPPYLLYFADADGDDQPDGAPVVHLAGFGLEDTHSAANSLRWGPDGWLYGTQGSGCSSRIHRPGVEEESAAVYFKGQVIWRYHPRSRRFELFAEGGGNTFGLEFDAAGRAFSGHNGGGTRGFHFVQGGFYSKNFGEHGYLTNPYTFGHFGSMGHRGDSNRFTHTFIIYEGGALGERFEGRLMSPMPLHHRVLLSDRAARGSTFETTDTATVIESGDEWFRPVDIKAGPDGAVYIADWYDTRLSHMDPYDTWDKAQGRVYRLKPKQGELQRADLSDKSSAQLIESLTHRNKWVRQTALRLLYDRSDASAIDTARRLANSAQSPYAVEGLWALHASGGLTDDAAAQLLGHAQPIVRQWMVRLLGDRPGGVSRPIADRLAKLAVDERDIGVISQLASTARRLPGEAALPIIDTLLRRDANGDDDHVPLLLWWAMEAHAEPHADRIAAMFSDASLWRQPLVRGAILERLARRYAAHPTPTNQQTLRTLLRTAPDDEARRRLIAGVNQAFEGQSSSALLTALQGDAAGNDDADPQSIALAIRGGNAPAIGRGLAILNDPASPADARIAIIKAMTESGRTESITTLLELLRRSTDDAVRSAAVAGLGRFDRPEVADGLLKYWSSLTATLRLQAAGVLCSRKEWAGRLLDAAVSSGTIAKADLPVDLVSRIALLNDDDLTNRARENFGAPLRGSTAEKDLMIQRIAATLRKGGEADKAAGAALFTQRCAVCHTLFGQGGKVGPDLTGYERGNVEYMLLHVIDPSAAIREGYGQVHIETRDGRNLVGVIADRDANRMILLDANGQSTAVALRDIVKQTPIPVSIMPEGLLNDLSDSQLRAWFGYLSSRDGP